MKRRFSLFLAILMLVSVFSPLGLGFEGNEIRFSTNVVEAAEGDTQSNEATPKGEVNDASNEVTPKEEVNDASSEATPKEEVNNASEEVTPDVDLKDQNIIQTNAILTIGKDPSERNFTWYSNTTVPGKFEFKEANVDKDFTGATVLNANVIEKVNKKGFSSNSVTLEGLKPNTEYMYRYSNGETVSEVVNFKTQGTEDFSFFIAGDPQIGSGGYLNGKEGWDKTLKLLPSIDPNASFLLSLGDQVNTSSDEEQYDEYINREGFKGLTLATVIGNHDSGNRAYTEHFKFSNVQEEGKTTAGSNYYYVYNNTLFICLNSNNRDYAEHKSTIKKAIAENPNVKWKVVAFHHPPYTVASHALDGYISNMRSTLVPIFKENKIDLVLNGHDHVYTRTHVMDGTKPIIEWENGEEGKAPSEYVNPKGIIYVTTNSASGSKHYNIMKNQNFEFSAFKNQEYVPNISNLKITDNSIEVTTYRTSDKNIVDSFKIIKEDPTPVKPSEVRVTFKVDENKGKFVPNEDGVILNTRVLPMNFDATRLEKMAPEVEGLDGYEFKGWDKEFVGELDQDLIINAIFEKVEKTQPEEDPTPVKPSEVRVTFKVDENKGKFLPNEDGVILYTRVLPMNFDATKLEKMAPEVEGLDGYKFKGWDKEFVGELDQDLIINAIFEKVGKTEPEEDNSVEPTKPTPTKPEKDDTREELIRFFPKHHDRTETHPVYVSKSSIFTKEDALKKGKEIADKNLAKTSVKPTDIDGHWAKDSINYALENNLIDLIGNEFKPNDKATRYTVVKALGKFKKIDVEKYKGKSLKDVDASSEESAYINWAIENGIIAGYEDNTFRGDREITREEIARILNLFVKKFNMNTKDLEAPKFKDQNQVSDWAAKDVKEATEKGLLVGRDDGTFGPKDNLTRAEVAQMIVNMIK